MASSLDRQRVDTSYSQNTYSSYYNLKASTGFCHAHDLTTDIYGREVGDYGVKRYDANCGDVMDKVQNLSNILAHENNMRPGIFQQTPQEAALEEAPQGYTSHSGYATLDQTYDMRIINDEETDYRSELKEPIVYHLQ